MIKILYPFLDKSASTTKSQFNQEYYNLVKHKVDESKINSLLKKITPSGTTAITLEKLLTADFNKLLNYRNIIEKSKIKKDLSRCFIVGILKPANIYDNTQGIISGFFMDKKINMKTCHYCNIDYINLFEERYSYTSLQEFITEAPKEALMKMDEISEATAKKIRSNRRWNNFNKSLKRHLGEGTVYKKLNSFLNDDTAKKLIPFNYKQITILKNHFTLDHFLPKNEFPYFGLSLYNLVPSCNSCNCKFKGAQEFATAAKLSWLSPTSTTFKLDYNLEFKLYFNVIGLDLQEKIRNVDTLNDFTIKIEDKKSINGFETYLNMFKLPGRFEFHRPEALKMIKKRSDYPDSQIKELSELFTKKGVNKDEESIKKDLFGSNIFNPDENNESLAKYRKDIAVQLGLLK